MHDATQPTSGGNGHSTNGKSIGIPFPGEKIIPLKNVPSLPLFAERPSYLKVKHWYRYGVYANRFKRKVRLEGRREGRLIFTSVEAVQRFLEALQDG